MTYRPEYEISISGDLVIASPTRGGVSIPIGRVRQHEGKWWSVDVHDKQVLQNGSRDLFGAVQSLMRWAKLGESFVMPGEEI